MYGGGMLMRACGAAPLWFVNLTETPNDDDDTHCLDVWIVRLSVG